MISNESSEQILGAGAFAIGSTFPQILSRATDARRGAPTFREILWTLRRRRGVHTGSIDYSHRAVHASKRDPE